MLFKSADQFIIGAVATARNFQISPIVIGLTIVAFGTSAPEIFVSAISSFENNPGLAVGDAIGSNIANVGMVLGFTAIIVPLKFRVDILRHDLTILVFVTLCAGSTLVDLLLVLWDGLLLFVGLGVFLFRLAAERRKSTSTDAAADIDELNEIPTMSKSRSMGLFTCSLIFLLLSCELLVWPAVNIALLLDLSELIIGLTVIAVGTSQLELVVSMTSAPKGQAELAMSNIGGSNIFNILAVLSTPCVIALTEVGSDVLCRDYAVMLLLTLVFVVFAYQSRAQTSINRLNAVLLVSIWLGYLHYLYQTLLGG